MDARQPAAARIAALLPPLASYPGPRYQALASAIGSLLLDGRLSPGARLPSERVLATALAMSRTTVTSAYELLDERGLLLRRHGAGSFLQLPAGSRSGGPGSKTSLGATTGAPTELIDLSVACMHAPDELEQAIATAAGSMFAAVADTDGYQPHGLPELRQRIADRFTERGIPTVAEEILITNGAQHALGLLLSWRLQPGDRVLIELPTYAGAIESIRLHHGRPVAVPVDAAGWDVTGMQNALAQSAPRMAFLVPDFHNPTGMLVPTADRAALCQAARRSSTTVVVDESYVDLDLRPAAERARTIDEATPMALLDDRVITIGSMSKPYWGGIRVGWIRAGAEAISQLVRLRAAGDMTGSVLDQLVACALLDRSETIRAGRRRQLREGRQALLTALAQQLPQWRPRTSVGGPSLWVELDRPASSALTGVLDQRGVLLAPGGRFGAPGTLEGYLRLPYARDPDVLREAVVRIAAAWTDLGPSVAVRDDRRLISV